MLPQISATIFFCFGISIISIGYIIVEIFWWDNYRFKKSLERNKRNLFDRIVHYVIWWIIINAISIFFGWIINVLNIFNSFGELVSNGFKVSPIYQTQLQFILFCICFFFLTLILSIIFFWIWKGFMLLWKKDIK
jgi:hypothetical protein